jgi:hypothetical protein
VHRSLRPNKVLDRDLFEALSLKVRKLFPFCQIKDGHVCNGYLQMMHIISRNYKGVAFLLDDVVTGCAGVHRYYTDRHIEWQEYWLATDPERWRRLWDKARAYEKNPFPKNDKPALLQAIKDA